MINIYLYQFKEIKMDTFTAEILTKMAQGIGDLNMVADISKQLKNNNPDSVTEAVANAKKLGFVSGAKVTLTGHSKIGKITGHNNKGGGFYCGSRCPIVVEWDHGTFPYEIESLVLVEENCDGK
jgi:hypothetical protein